MSGILVYMGKRTVNIGDIFGKLTILCESESRVYVYKNRVRRQKVYKCKCECGNVVDRVESALFNSKNSNCGCVVNGKTHGLRKHPLYSRWVGMRKRCYNKKYIEFHLYGGRGIRVCDEWVFDFKAFFDWSIANGFSEELDLDRFPDMNGDYSPTNCRWATRLENANNTRACKPYLFKGEMLTVAEISRRTGIYDETIRWRLNLGMSMEEIVLLGTNRKKRSKSIINVD